MKLSSYLSDKKTVLLACFIGSLFFCVLLGLFGIGIGEIVLLWICFSLMTAGLFVRDYLGQRRRIRYLRAVMNDLDQKYLFAEIAEAPMSELEKIYFELMRTALKAMTDEVSQRRENAQHVLSRNLRRPFPVGR